MHNEQSDPNTSSDVLFVAGTDFQNVGSNSTSGGSSSNIQASFRGGDDSGKKGKGGVMSKFSSFMNAKVFSRKQKHRFVQNIVEISQLFMDNPNAGDKPRKSGGIFAKNKKKGDKG